MAEGTDVAVVVGVVIDVTPNESLQLSRWPLGYLKAPNGIKRI